MYANLIGTEGIWIATSVSHASYFKIGAHLSPLKFDSRRKSVSQVLGEHNQHYDVILYLLQM